MSIKGFEVGGVQAKYDYESLDNIPANLVQDANYVHTDNNFTNADKTKLSGIEAQANKTTIDATLTQSGQAADAKATGDAISALNAQVIASMPHDTASGSIASFPDGADDVPVKSLVCQINPVQSGSGDPSPENVRPISGFTGLNVFRTGKNLLPNSAASSGTFAGAVSYVKNADGSISLSGTATEDGNFSLVLSSAHMESVLKNGQSYVLSGCPQGGSSSTYRLVLRYVTNGSQYAIDTGNGASYTMNNPSSVTCYIRVNSGTNCDGLVFKPMLRLAADTDATYAPYNGNTYSVSWQSSAGTVYGGIINLTTGLLTVDRSYLIGGQDFTLDVGPNSVYTNTYVYANTSLASLVPPIPTAETTSIICTALPSISRTQAATGGGTVGVFQYHTDSSNSVRFAFPREDAYSTTGKVARYLQDMITAGTPFAIAIPLKTPQTYQLTPQQVNTFLGINNLWADTGDTAVTYRADPTLYINKKIAAAVAALS